MSSYPNYMGNTASEVCDWVENFALKLPDYEDYLELAPTDIVYAGSIAKAMTWEERFHVPETRDAARAATAARDELMMDKEPTRYAPVIYNFTPAPALPVPLDDGVVRWLDKLVKRIRTANGYTANIGAELRIIPPATPAKPVKAAIMGLKALPDFQVEVDAKRAGAKTVLYYDMANPDAPQLLGFVPSATWIDKRPPAVPNQPQSRSYAVRYGDAQGEPLPDSLMSDASSLVTHG